MGKIKTLKHYISNPELREEGTYLFQSSVQLNQEGANFYCLLDGKEPKSNYNNLEFIPIKIKPGKKIEMGIAATVPLWQHLEDKVLKIIKEKIKTPVLLNQ